MLEKLSLIATKVIGALSLIAISVISIVWVLIAVFLTIDLFGWSLMTFVKMIGGVM